MSSRLSINKANVNVNNKPSAAVHATRQEIRSAARKLITLIQNRHRTAEITLSEPCWTKEEMVSELDNLKGQAKQLPTLEQCKTEGERTAAKELGGRLAADARELVVSILAEMVIEYGPMMGDDDQDEDYEFDDGITLRDDTND